MIIRGIATVSTALILAGCGNAERIVAPNIGSTKESMNHDDFAWSLAESTNKERPFFIRFAEVKESFNRTAYPHRLNVFWALRAPMENGLPSEQDYEETEVFEERLVEAIEAGAHSVLPMILTGRGQKEYVIQTTDPQLFLNALTKMPQEEEKYPIEITHNKDDSWDYFDRVLSDVEIKDAEQSPGGDSLKAAPQE